MALDLRPARPRGPHRSRAPTRETGKSPSQPKIGARERRARRRTARRASPRRAAPQPARPRPRQETTPNRRDICQVGRPTMTAGARRGKHTIHDTRLHEAPHHRRLHALHEKQRTPAVMAIVRDTKPDRDAAIHEVRRKEQQAPRAEPQRRAELSLRQVVGGRPFVARNGGGGRRSRRTRACADHRGTPRAPTPSNARAQTLHRVQVGCLRLSGVDHREVLLGRRRPETSAGLFCGREVEGGRDNLVHTLPPPPHHRPGVTLTVSFTCALSAAATRRRSAQPQLAPTAARKAGAHRRKASAQEPQTTHRSGTSNAGGSQQGGPVSDYKGQHARGSTCRSHRTSKKKSSISFTSRSQNVSRMAREVLGTSFR